GRPPARWRRTPGREAPSCAPPSAGETSPHERSGEEAPAVGAAQAVVEAVSESSPFAEATRDVSEARDAETGAPAPAAVRRRDRRDRRSADRRPGVAQRGARADLLLGRRADDAREHSAAEERGAPQRRRGALLARSRVSLGAEAAHDHARSARRARPPPPGARTGEHPVTRPPVGRLAALFVVI